MTRANTVADYESRVDRSGSCHVWTGRVNEGGYGEFEFEGQRVLAHRFGWEAVNGPIPAGQKVCHRCDNPPCQNLAHMFLGSQVDNIADRHAKGRDNRPAGEANPNHVLTDVQVDALRDDHVRGLSCPELARKYGIHRGHAWRLAVGRQRV